MSFETRQNKENDFDSHGALSAFDSPFSAFMSSPLKKEKCLQSAESPVSRTFTPKGNAKTNIVQRVALSPVSSHTLNSWSASRSSSAKHTSKAASPKPKLAINDSTNTSTNLSLGDDVFSAFISSPFSKKTVSYEVASDAVDVRMALFDENVASSPNPHRSSACFGALTLATSMDMFQEVGEGGAIVMEGANVTCTEVVEYHASSVMLDEMIAERTAHEIEQIEEQEQVKRSVSGSPKSKPNSHVPVLSSSKSRKALKHLRQQSIKAVKSALVSNAVEKPKVQFDEKVVKHASNGSNGEEVSDGNQSPTVVAKVVKGSPSRLAKSRLVSKMAGNHSRGPVAVPPSNVQPSQLKDNSRDMSDAFLKILSPKDDPLGAKNQEKSKLDSAAVGGRSRSATLDEAASGGFFNGFGTVGGMVAGRMYDVYGFEENTLRAPVVPSSVLVVNSSQMTFWQEWLSSTSSIQRVDMNTDEDSPRDSSPSFPSLLKKDALLSVPSSASSILASMTYSGVPQVLRGRVWANLVNVSQYRLDHSPVRGYYGELRSRGRHEKWGHQIDLDLPRTFCGHVYFRKEARGQKQLSNVLNAYSHYNEKVGYCQGMSFLVGMLLMLMEEEEKVFWTFCALMDRDEGRLASYYEPGMMGVLEDVNLFRKMILLEMPSLYAHFEKVGVDASFFVTRWLLSLFTDLSDWSTVLRFWDLYMLQGHLSLFRACLAILKANLSDLLSMKNCEHLFPFLLNLPFAKLNPSLIISMYRSIDIQYLFDEVTAPDSDQKYAVSHIHQPLPHHQSSKRRTTNSQSNDKSSLQRGLSKKQLAKLASKRAMVEQQQQQQMLPTTPLPRKSRPQSMMVFSSSSEQQQQQQQQPHEYHSKSSSRVPEDEIFTPSGKSKSFFGRMWDKLKSPAVSVISGSAKKSQPDKSQPSTPSVTLRASPSSLTPSSRSQTQSSASGPSPRSPSRRKLQFMRSPSRKSKKSLHGQLFDSSVTVASVSTSAGANSLASSDTAISAYDSSLPKRSSPKRKRDERSNDSTASAADDALLKQASIPASKKSVVAWVAEDTGENATKWDGGEELFMDKSERDAFIAFATATPIRVAAGSSRTGVHSTTPHPRDTPRHYGSSSSSKPSSIAASSSTSFFKTPPPPKDTKLPNEQLALSISTPKVIGAPMQLAPAFYHDASSSQTPSRTPATSKRKHGGPKVMSPIEMDSAWISTKP